MEARTLTTLVAEVLDRAWRRDSTLHGEHHWRCVSGTALALAARTPGADAAICLCFGLLHDTRRENDSHDPEHGPRAAELARALADDGLLALGSTRTDLLLETIALHADGRVSDDPTTGTCWDADRLHLPRVGIAPRPSLLSSVEGRRPDAVDAAAVLRAQPPSWAALVRLAAADARP